MRDTETIQNHHLEAVKLLIHRRGKSWLAARLAMYETLMGIGTTTNPPSVMDLCTTESRLCIIDDTAVPRQLPVDKRPYYRRFEKQPRRKK